MRMPVVFVSHGAPTLALHDGAAHRFLKDLAGTLPRPESILVVSAHWETDLPTLSLAARPETIYDFGRFDPRLFEMVYAAPGAPALAHRAAALLDAAGVGSAFDATRGLDHGAWVPLSLIYPAADIPVTQLSIQPDRDPAHHLRLGEALAPLREEGVLILATGAVTHNLRAFRGQPHDTPPEPWVTAFADWVAAALAARRVEDLLHYDTVAPFGAENHPTDEHFLPLFVALGASAPEETLTRVHSSTTYGVLAMDAYATA